MKPAILALDVDGVLNHFSKSAKSSRSAVISSLPITWRVPVIERLKTILSSPLVTGTWLTTWEFVPSDLRELEEALGLSGLVPLFAPFPRVDRPDGDFRILPDEIFPNATLATSSPRWWKYRSAELLIENNPDYRFAWLDDALCHTTSPELRRLWKPRITEDRFLLRTDERAGLLLPELEALSSWIFHGVS